MNEERAFLLAIAAQPDDDTRKLAFADWLDEQGDHPRAEYIRGQIALAQVTVDSEVYVRRIAPGQVTPESERYVELIERGRDLFEAHHAEWESGLRRQGAIHVDFHKGFPTSIRIQAADYLKNGQEIFATAPVTSVKLVQCTDSLLEELVASPIFARVRNLGFAMSPVTDRGATALASSPYATEIRLLDFQNTAISPIGGRKIALSKMLPNLEELIVPDTVRLGSAGREIRRILDRRTADIGRPADS
jgi:uncharacterized protein (TIGR02996 family)